MQWPNITNEPINEFHTLGLATQAFPTLFPFGTGDPTCSNHCCPVSLTEAFNYFVKNVDVVKVKGNLNGVFLPTHDFHTRR